MSNRLIKIALSLVCCLLSLPVVAQEVERLPSPESPAARVPRSAAAGAPEPLSYLQLAKAYRSAQRLHNYRYAAYPEQVRRLDAAIELTHAEAAVLTDRLRHYQQFASFGSDSPAYTAAQNTQLALMAADEQLRQLQRKRNLLSRQRRSTILSLQIEHLELLKQLKQQ